MIEKSVDVDIDRLSVSIGSDEKPRLEDMAAGIETPQDTAHPGRTRGELRSNTPQPTKEIGRVSLLGFE